MADDGVARVKSRMAKTRHVLIITSCIISTWFRSFHLKLLTDLDEIFQRFDVLGLLLWVVALFEFVRQCFFRDHFPHVRVRDGRHEVIFDVVLG